MDKRARLRALRGLFKEYDKEELVYIPMGADKGDCPFCCGTLERDADLELLLGVKECYLCPYCKSAFTEVGLRYFTKNIVI